MILTFGKYKKSVKKKKNKMIQTFGKKKKNEKKKKNQKQKRKYYLVS